MKQKKVLRMCIFHTVHSNLIINSKIVANNLPAYCKRKQKLIIII